MARWLQLDIPHLATAAEFVDWIESRPMAHMQRSIVDSVCSTVIWVLWTYRNAVVFKQKVFKKQFIFYKICDWSFNWFVYRNCKAKISWNMWMLNPLMP